MTRFSKPVQLDPGIGLDGFRCGDPTVDRWAKERSSTARRRGSAVIYASYDEDGLLAGFYTLSAHSVARADVEGGWFPRNAPDQVPAVLLGMMGVDERFKGLGLGAALLRDAVENSLKVSALAGARALVVDPTGDAAAAFYGHFGFAYLPGTDRMAIRLR